MKTCPTCNGTKKITFKQPFQHNDKIPNSNREISIKCITCNGNGELTEQAYNAHKKAMEAWCSCGNPSGQTTFYDDGEHPNCSKHCYTCNDCGKIVQVG